MSTPPPPPPHGAAPKSTAGTTASGLPPGKYDIFIIPPHSSGSGFLYLPSLQPNVNSFAAGFASALLCVLIGSAIAPAVMMWWNSAKGAGAGGSGMLILVLAVGIGAWALGRLQMNGFPGQGQAGGFGNSGWGGNFGGSGPNPNAGGPTPNPHSSSDNSYASGPPPGTGPMPGAGPGNGGPKPGWQRGAPPPGTSHAEAEPNTDSGASAKGAWERAREETKKKEEERKAREAERRRKEEAEKKLREQREREAREREAREREAEERRQAAAREKEAREREAEANRQREEAIKEAARQREQAVREAAKLREEAIREATRVREEAAREAKRKDDEARELRKKEEEALEKRRKEVLLAEQRLKEAQEAREREARQRAILEKRRLDEEARQKRVKEAEEREREKKKKEEEEAAAKKLAEELKPRGSMYAFSAVGEKTNPWPQGRPKTPPPRPAPPSPTKKPPPPTARTYKGTDDDPPAYKPYERKPARKNSFNSSYSHSSYAASQSTSRTTPPPSTRNRYTTKDPDKIVIKAVYAFSNAYSREPISKLISGQSPVTDGLILRITTEGLFIDDDVRGVPQREWDVKAWTMKLVEVWCPSFRQGPAGISPDVRNASAKHNPVRRLWGLDKDKPASPEEIDALLNSMLSLCKNNCRLHVSSSASSSYSASSFGDDRASVASDSAYGSSVGDSTDNRGAHQTGESAKLHVLRASIRDQEGKRYVFVITEEESWKIAVGLQRLRKGTQVRALGVSGMSPNDAKNDPREPRLVMINSHDILETYEE